MNKINGMMFKYFIVTHYRRSLHYKLLMREIGMI
jgi:hypothetical protein